MGKVLIGNLKGPKGDKGDPGDDGGASIPPGGIPAESLSPEVQASLARANEAIVSINDLEPDIHGSITLPPSDLPPITAGNSDPENPIPGQIYVRRYNRY